MVFILYWVQSKLKAEVKWVIPNHLLFLGQGRKEQCSLSSLAHCSPCFRCSATSEALNLEVQIPFEMCSWCCYQTLLLRTLLAEKQQTWGLSLIFWGVMKNVFTAPHLQIQKSHLSHSLSRVKQKQCDPSENTPLGSDISSSALGTGADF